jgi:hypothetical protein
MTYMSRTRGYEERYWILAIAAIALLARLGVVILQNTLGLFDIVFEGGDGPLYVSLATTLLEGDGFSIEGEPTAFVTPGYPLFVAAVFAFSESLLSVAIVQSVVGTVGVVYLALAGDRVGGRPAGMMTGVLASLYPHSLLWTPQVMTETVYVALLSLGVYLVVRLVDETPTSRFTMLTTGAIFGAAALVRPPVLGFALLLLLGGVLKRRWRGASVYAGVGLLLVFGPWVVRNLAELDAVVITSTESGYVLWQGNSPDATGGTRGYVDHEDFTPLTFPEGTSEVERDRIYFEQALSWMKRNPGEVLSLIPKKLGNMLRPSWEGASDLNLAATLVTYPLLMLLGVIGILRMPSTEVRWLLVLFLIYNILLHGLVTGMIRFRLPIEMVLTIPAGVATAAVLGRSRTFLPSRGES